ncbi:MAG: methylene-tetrahydromethanopterin reductase [Aeromicrobium sp.]|jgi:5,10-methylenetetrahydromethanopterin reductase|nr:methylene-tetrahydromethanopterin reductase [Aeromicrobium sp.]
MKAEVHVDISCAFPTTLRSPDDIVLAEELGYARAWLYDTPQQSPDVWMCLALAAARTSRIGLGPGVLVPSLRHPMVNAAAAASLEALAPGRVAVGFGTGFSGRRAMGYPGLPMRFMADYVRAFRGLLAGETVEWEGARMRMMHPEGHAAPRPVHVPVLFGVHGPRGGAVAKELGDGLLLSLEPLPEFTTDFTWSAMLAWGTVLGDDEATGSSHARAAAGPGWALAYHAAYEFGGLDAVRELDGGDVWADVVEAVDPDERHFQVHDQHCVALNDADAAAWEAGAHSRLKEWTVTGTRTEVRERVERLRDQGITEFVLQPSGDDVRGELERFKEATDGL